MSNSIPQKVLVLQGGGALGSYQAGVYDALHSNNYEPEWIAGISIGAINAAIIAGNKFDKRTEKLKAFWELVTSVPEFPFLSHGDYARAAHNEFNATMGTITGIPGFFKPHSYTGTLNPFFSITMSKISFYDTSPLKETLENLIDFDLINKGDIRLSIGAVHVKSGNFVYFDSKHMTIKPEHIMASGALPEGFPPIEIDGEYYWDGGLVSNTPLHYVMDTEQQQDLCIHQIDLFNAKGDMPTNIFEVQERIKDIRFSSRTRMITDNCQKKLQIQHLFSKIADKIPNDLLDTEERSLLKEWSSKRSVNIVHLIYQSKSYETSSKDYEFSNLSMREHWQSGIDDANKMLENQNWRRSCSTKGNANIFDINKDILLKKSA